MSGERAKRFPLALEDLKREPRKPEGRAAERQATGDAARQRLTAAAAAAPAAASALTPDRRTYRAAGATGAAGVSVPKAKATHAKKHASGAPGGAKGAPPASAKSGDKSAAPNVALTGALALTSERVRERMVERLQVNGVTDPRVLAAMAAVPRHMFVDPGLAAQAYEDAALPIGHQQTISKPSVVARMIELAAAGRALERVLEIGTGCGYQAAVLSRVARDVYSIERVKPLYERAKLNLRPLRVPNIRLHYGDGRVGLPAAAPFDAIVIAAAGLDVPRALLEQLAIGGRLVAPVGEQAGEQVLTLVERVAPAQWRESRLDRVFFVPLKSGVI
ncbi:protein-L-isoaspartate(D-aspartate) O-methyltransferase [Burkholderia mayonis]|uniref:Protein-L-isoaspartate O-methyltransferase n=1 Tax=Burkholderia mayonis TaxID=1385591 RepID=A0A1B4G7J3_9BURK|nr:protein-L-isoaspartate(D-aspartate) O-methyltransferase [Burkholderia mayonis]AOJ11878.1 protein-L-isoaspartate O-methyltransferase [Burkholderia mayonis]KVE49413.1 protein-L-isoaspartate O-methyltransferase [Burkholderia mayonis]